jgi:hypothetical protein
MLFHGLYRLRGGGSSRVKSDDVAHSSTNTPKKKHSEHSEHEKHGSDEMKQHRKSPHKQRIDAAEAHHARTEMETSEDEVHAHSIVREEDDDHVQPKKKSHDTQPHGADIRIQSHNKQGFDIHTHDKQGSDTPKRKKRTDTDCNGQSDGQTETPSAKHTHDSDTPKRKKGTEAGANGQTDTPKRHTRAETGQSETARAEKHVTWKHLRTLHMSEPSEPFDVAIGPHDGMLYIADSLYHRIGMYVCMCICVYKPKKYAHIQTDERYVLTSRLGRMMACCTLQIRCIIA